MFPLKAYILLFFDLDDNRISQTLWNSDVTSLKNNASVRQNNGNVLHDTVMQMFCITLIFLAILILIQQISNVP